MKSSHEKRMRMCLIILPMLLMAMFCAISCGPNRNKELAQKILQDERLQKVDSMARELLKQGFNAGSGYSEIWARDLNTFILTSLDVVPVEEVREALLIFFRMQQPNGEMIDGYVVNNASGFNGEDTV
ncbi:MAG: hypothetical protein II402_01295, partial [Bacteroidaceae bacterium]|nr:hypothetical protein [Bacteroidaceae bacterium]